LRASIRVELKLCGFKLGKLVESLGLVVLERKEVTSFRPTANLRSEAKAEVLA